MFYPSPTSFANLDSAQTFRLDTISDIRNPIIIGQYLLKMNTLSSQNISGGFSLQTGVGDCGGINFSITYLKYTSNGDFILLAETIEEDTSGTNVIGNMYLIAENGVYYGDLTYENYFFEFYSLGGGEILLAELDYNYIDEVTEIEGLMMQSATTLGSQSLGEYECQDCVVDVLVVYTSKTKKLYEKWFGLSFSTYISSQFVVFNEASRRSSHNGIYAKLRLKHHQETYIDTNFGIPRNFLIELALYNDTLDALRTLHKADIVTALVWELKSLVRNGWSGTTFSGPTNDGTPAEKIYAYGVINPRTASSKTIPHEWGHTFGARHNNDGTPYACKAKVFKVKKCDGSGKASVGTMVSQTSANYKGIRYFSNPNIRYCGVPTGDVASRNNQHFLTTNSCTIANYYGGYVTNAKYIIGPSYACPLSSVILKACYFTGDVEPIDISWYSSSNAIIWTFVGTGQQQTAVMPSNPGQILFVKVVITMPTGPVTTKYHSIQVGSSINGFPCALKTNNNFSVSTLNYDVELIENPVENELTLRYINTSYSFSSKITMYNIIGEKVLQKDYEVFGSDELLIDVSSFNTGQYFIVVELPNKVKSIKFIKL